MNEESKAIWSQNVILNERLKTTVVKYDQKTYVGI